MHNDQAFHVRPGMGAFGSQGKAGQAARADACADPCPPACPACGGLQCLCRPRFFPGQLLTDETLNQLSRYVVEKNKLHNRYLQGWGVACGLEVSCDPCNPQQVVVSTGYALGPCGDDIVVCNDQAVNICELIDQCTPARQNSCDPPYERAPQDCRAGTNSWVLAICYDERPSRGLTALLGASDTRCQNPCRCGGATGCRGCGGSGCAGGSSCGCGGQGSTTAAGPGGCATPPYNSRPKKSRTLNCEPTQVCEGYRFVAYPAPKNSGPTPLPTLDGHGAGVAGFMSRLVGWMFTNRAQLGPLLERLMCCMANAQDLLGAWGQGQQIKGDFKGAEVMQAYQQYAQAMFDFGSAFRVHNCASVSKISRLYDNAIAFANDAANTQEWKPEQVAHIKGQFEQLDGALMELLGECLCSALLPPCPEPQADNCVPLAVVTLRGNDCRVVDICNWQARKLLITWRTVSYWLSWLPWHCLRQFIARFCCDGKRNASVLRMLSLVLGVSVVGSFCGKVKHERPPQGGGDNLAPPKLDDNFNIIGQPMGVAKAFMDADKLGADGDLVMQLLEEFDRARSGLSAAPAWFKLAARASDGSLLDDVASIGGAGGLAEMQTQLNALMRVVHAQQAQIDALHKQVPGQPAPA